MTATETLTIAGATYEVERGPLSVTLTAGETAYDLLPGGNHTVVAKRGGFCVGGQRTNQMTYTVMHADWSCDCEAGRHHKACKHLEMCKAFLLARSNCTAQSGQGSPQVGCGPGSEDAPVSAPSKQEQTIPLTGSRPVPAESNGAYHADTSAISHSMLEVFRRSIPEYAGRFVTKKIPAPPPTPQMRFGSLFHTYLLEPDTFERRYHVVSEKADRRSNAGKELAEQQAVEANGRELLTGDELALLRAMALGVQENELAASILAAPGKVEHVLRWTDDATGLPLKCRMDKLTAGGIIVDLKTAAGVSPWAWAKAVVDFGYARQAAMYLDGAARVPADGPFLFVAVGKEPPHECVVYQLDEDALQLGKRQNAAMLRELAERMERDDWSSRWQGVQPTTLPKYAFSQD